MSVQAFATPEVTSLNVPVQVQTINVSVRQIFETPMPSLGTGNYFITVDRTVLELGDPDLYKIVWNLMPAAAGIPPIAFSDPGVIFAEAGAPFLKGSRNATSIEGYWSNLEARNRRAFPYTLYVTIGTGADSGVLVLDPTVENQPPL